MSEFIKVIIRHGDKDVEEDIAMPEGLTQAEQEKMFKKIVTDFNAEEERRHKEYPNYPMDKKRTFVKILGPIGKYYCDFEKISLVSRTLANGIADTLQCRRCGFKMQRYSLYTEERRPCHPGTVCTQCNKEYKDLEKHKETHRRKNAN